jgi:hypothetical protein
MPGAAGADDPALEQARLAQMPPRAWQDSWRARHTALAAQAVLCPSSGAAQGGTPAGASGAWPEGSSPHPGEPGGAPAAITGVQATGGDSAAWPKPVPPALTHEQREAARLRAVRLAGLRSGELTLAKLLAQAQSGPAAFRMPVRNALMALPGIRTTRASQLMTQAGVGGGCRVGALSARQRGQLVGAVATVRLQSPSQRR